jgi:hypothetical protein
LSRPTLDATDAGGRLSRTPESVFCEVDVARDTEGVSRVYTRITRFTRFLSGGGVSWERQRAVGAGTRRERKAETLCGIGRNFGERRTLLERLLRRFGRPHARAHAERGETDLRGRTARARASWCRRRRRARGTTPALVGGCRGVSLQCAVGADDSTSERDVSGTPRFAPAGRTPPRVP